MKESDPALASMRRADGLARLPRVPREVYGLLTESGQPLKPYELLWRLQSTRGRSMPPSSVYRALAALSEAGLVHRIASLRAYICCALVEPYHQPAFLICQSCKCVAEIDVSALVTKQEAAMQTRGIVPRAFQLSADGVCAKCISSGASGAGPKRSKLRL